jgi:hypothetical protein
MENTTVGPATEAATTSEEVRNEPAPRSNAALATDDLLQIRVYEISGEDKAALGRALMERIRTVIAEMSVLSLQEVAQFVDLVEHEAGGLTPAEEFIRGILLHHYVRGLTPKDVADQLATFREDFESALSRARRFALRYPQLMN